MARIEKFHISIVFILVVILIGISIFFYYGNIKKNKLVFKTRLDYYNRITKNEQQWLAGLQQSNGALAFRGKENGIVSIVPYFSSITAIGLLQKEPDFKYKEVVLKYFKWHFSHLNDAESDKYGVAGTIYDYSAEVDNGVVRFEKTEQDYDSVDSYAALFLIALWEYYEQTKDKEYLIEQYQQINDIIGAMNATIDKDGLSFTKPDKPVKYLMDNSEVCQGLSCAINLFEQVYLPHFSEETIEYHSVKAKILHLRELRDNQKKAFHAKFWNETEQRFEIGIDKKGAVLDFTGWNEFYPDAVAQLFPIIFGVINPNSEQARNLYGRFNEHFKWESMAHYENGSASFYWGLTAYCGALMRDEQKVRSYMDYYKTNVLPDHKYPAYNADVAWVVLASAEMAKYYQEQMQKIDPLGIVNLE